MLLLLLLLARFVRLFYFVSMHSSALRALECIERRGATSDSETGAAEIGDAETCDGGTRKSGTCDMGTGNM